MPQDAQVLGYNSPPLREPLGSWKLATVSWVALRVGKAKGARNSAAGEMPQPPEPKHPGFQTTQSARLNTMNLSIRANKIHDKLDCDSWLWS